MRRACASADVDDLDDQSKLEEYIAASAVIVIFMSRGCARPANAGCTPAFDAPVVPLLAASNQ